MLHVVTKSPFDGKSLLSFDITNSAPYIPRYHYERYVGG